MKEPIRVLCVFSTLDRGGAETMCMNLYRNIDRSLVQFDFVKHTHQKGLFEDEIIALGGRIVEAPRYYIYNYRKYITWWRETLSEHPEWQIIHGHFFTISSFYFKVAHETGRITIGHSHCIHPQEKGVQHIKQLLSYPMIGKIEQRSDYCFACSTPAGKWLFPNKQFKVLKNAIDVANFAFNPEIREKIRRNLHIEDCFVVGVCGRIIPSKNPIEIVDIFREIHMRRPQALLMWVGDGPLRKQVEERIRECNLQSSVLMMGVCSNVNELMQAMDVFIFPSIYEGLGIVAVEAQATGMHCFCSDTVPEEAKVTDRCHFLPLGKPELWAKQIVNIECNHVEAYDAIIKAGYDIHETAMWLTNFYINCKG